MLLDAHDPSSLKHGISQSCERPGPFSRRLGHPTPSTRMMMQRYFNYLSVQTRRCRLHLPYLMRTGTSKPCGYSRYICLDTARSILRLYGHTPSLEGGSGKRNKAFRTVGFLPHFFFATTILVGECFIALPKLLAEHYRQLTCCS